MKETEREGGKSVDKRTLQTDTQTHTQTYTHTYTHSLTSAILEPSIFVDGKKYT